MPWGGQNGGTQLKLKKKKKCLSHIDNYNYIKKIRIKDKISSIKYPIIIILLYKL